MDTSVLYNSVLLLFDSLLCLFCLFILGLLFFILADADIGDDAGKNDEGQYLFL